VVTRQEGFDFDMPQHGFLAAADFTQDETALPLSISVPEGFQGTLYVHVVDWNNKVRRSRIRFEGRDLGILQSCAGGGVWLALPLEKEQASDGKVEFVAEYITGPNALIAQFVVGD
jgi:hypothetical protein